MQGSTRARGSKLPDRRDAESGSKPKPTESERQEAAVMGTRTGCTKDTQFTSTPTSFQTKKCTTLQQRAGAQVEGAAKTQRRWPKEFKKPPTSLLRLIAEVHLYEEVGCVTFKLGLDLPSRFS